jgi:hypothetical protein
MDHAAMRGAETAAAVRPAESIKVTQPENKPIRIAEDVYLSLSLYVRGWFYRVHRAAAVERRLPDEKCAHFNIPLTPFCAERLINLALSRALGGPCGSSSSILVCSPAKPLFAALWKFVDATVGFVTKIRRWSLQVGFLGISLLDWSINSNKPGTLRLFCINFKKLKR